MERYILSIDQSTSATKALLFDEAGALAGRHDVPHRQMVDEKGWVEHDPTEIWQNLLLAVQGLLAETAVPPGAIACVGISNQRETAMVWDKTTGKPLHNAVVWQCARGEAICKEIEAAGHAARVQQVTGLPLSPYFSAAKIAWVLRHTGRGKGLCCGTMDSWLLFKLTGRFATDASNAARTQLYDICKGAWSEEMCTLFGVPMHALPQVMDSDAHFGDTDFDGQLPGKIPVCGVLGDSNGALFGQGCFAPGMTKATYGTGSSVMMNIGNVPVFSNKGVVTSIAWARGGTVQYVLEGNINYTGAAIKWVAEDLGLLASPKEAGNVAKAANPEDETYLIPAFSGLGAPYWDSGAKAMWYGMGRTTGRAELVKAAEECIAYQIADVLQVMQEEAGLPLEDLRTDGGPTRDAYLMQFQSDIAGAPLLVPAIEELSGLGAAYLAGIAAGVYHESIVNAVRHRQFTPAMAQERRQKKLAGWRRALQMLLARPQ